MNTDTERTFAALDCAVTAAEAGMQATLALWESLTCQEKDRWLVEQAAICWRRRDISLKTILPAAVKVASDENEAA